LWVQEGQNQCSCARNGLQCTRRVHMMVTVAKAIEQWIAVELNVDDVIMCSYSQQN